jgi:hypothetical protein
LRDVGPAIITATTTATTMMTTATTTTPMKRHSDYGHANQLDDNEQQ